MNNAEVDLLNRAIDALQKGNLQESEALFREILGSSELGGQALAGIGMIRLTQGDPAGANELFQSALLRGPDADALYGLGVLAERAGDNQKAFGYQLRALQVNPSHGGAHKRLEALQKLAFSTAPSASPVPPAMPPVMPPAMPSAMPPAMPRAMPSTMRPAMPPPATSAAPKGAGAFELILSGDQVRARDQALAFLERFKMKRRPRLTAYFGSVLTIIVLPVLMIVGTVFYLYQGQSPGTSRHTTPPQQPHASRPVESPHANQPVQSPHARPREPPRR